MSLEYTKTVLANRRDTIAAELALMGSMGPNFSLDGVSIDNLAYAMGLRDELSKVIADYERLSGPVVIFSQGR